MHKTMECVEDLGTMKEKLMEWTKQAMAPGPESINTDEMGKVVDMIKDLAEAEKDCWKACYYKLVTEAMEEGEGMPELPEWMPTDRAGYDNWRYSSGRFAPKGRGHRSGYTPYHMPPDGRMGYPHEDPEMQAEHMINTLKEIWKEADPDLRQRIKKDLNSLTGSMM